MSEKRAVFRSNTLRKFLQHAAVVVSDPPFSMLLNRVPSADRRWLGSHHPTTFMAFLSYSQDAYMKWREGSLPAELRNGWELVIMNLVNALGGTDFWDDRGYLFGDEFRHHIESDIRKRKPHPRAKPGGAFSIGDTN
jgi:hypothetical protein